jgi:predicted DNA-binding transcriptional regulator YafY
VLKGYNWYVYGYCLLRQDYRIFRLSRIKELEVSPETFVPRPDAAPAEPLSWERGESSESLLHLVMHFGPKSRAKVEDYFDQEEITDLPDGSMWVRCLRPDEPWLYGFLLGFGADVKVLEPAQAASTLRQKAMEIIKLYPEH